MGCIMEVVTKHTFKCSSFIFFFFFLLVYQIQSNSKPWLCMTQSYQVHWLLFFVLQDKGPTFKKNSFATSSRMLSHVNTKHKVEYIFSIPHSSILSMTMYNQDETISHIIMMTQACNLDNIITLIYKSRKKVKEWACTKS